MNRCDKCGEQVSDLDAGFSPGLHAMAHDCGGTWRVVSESTLLKARIAEALGWSETEADAFSLASLRELLPAGKLRDEVSEAIRVGAHIPIDSDVAAFGYPTYRG
jgi:hypothetical protein